jgi:Putative transposase
MPLALESLPRFRSHRNRSPDVHMIVPGGGISIDQSLWIAKQPDFFLPVRVLWELFRRLMIEKCQTASNFGSDSLSMKFAVRVALIWRENQRHASRMQAKSATGLSVRYRSCGRCFTAAGTFGCLSARS